jgi:hypothetical protein
MPKDKHKEEVINVTFQLKGEEAEEFLKYMEQEFISINSVAGKKLALERLKQWKAQLARPVAA